MPTVGAVCEAEYYPRPPPAVRADIVSLAQKLTGRWFTANVPADIEKDLLFQDAIVLRLSGRTVAFAVITCLDGAVQISLLGADPELHGRGLGTRLLAEVRAVATAAGVERIRVMTTPPDVNPEYAPTLAFYVSRGFVVKRIYTELWEHGAVELEMEIGQ